MGASQNFMTFFFMGWDWRTDKYWRLGSTSLYVTDDPDFGGAMTAVTDEFFSSGFHVAIGSFPGKYLKIKRDTLGGTAV